MDDLLKENSFWSRNCKVAHIGTLQRYYFYTTYTCACMRNVYVCVCGLPLPGDGTLSDKYKSQMYNNLVGRLEITVGTTVTDWVKLLDLSLVSQPTSYRH